MNNSSVIERVRYNSRITPVSAKGVMSRISLIAMSYYTCWCWCCQRIQLQLLNAACTNADLLQERSLPDFHSLHRSPTSWCQRACNAAISIS